MNDKQVERVIYKLTRLETLLDSMLFKKIGVIEATKYITKDKLSKIPDSALFSPVIIGETWGEEKEYCWFKASYIVPKEFDGEDIFFKPAFGGYEGLLWVNGVPFGNFARRITYTAHGNHYCKMLKKNAHFGEKIEIVDEVYAGHSFIGKMPEDTYTAESYNYVIGESEICIKNTDIYDFYYNLKTINELWRSVEYGSFTRGKIINLILEINQVILFSPDDCEYTEFIDGIKKANLILKDALSKMQSHDCGEARIVGHSHIDTAWIWEIDETIKKCARTFSNQMSYMEQYPEYKFMQSSSYHLELMRINYPELFKNITKYVAEGRYEPNGGAWVECDCNIIGAESMIRQFLWGQRFTRKYFNYTSNTFWLPDTFGYSAAIPQIMQGCGIKYFCTTKLEWNDTTQFPYDTFYWEGIDSTKVFAHFNKTNLWPAPEHVTTYTSAKNVRNISQKSVNDMRLLAIGYGDGGGGPEPDMLEMAKRCQSLEGCPKVSYTRVDDFMIQLENRAVNPSTWSGELYLELHRGTLTGQHNIKRNNRKAEIALHNVELLVVNNAIANNVDASEDEIAPLVEIMLVNQFHDILPGTCIPEAHDRAINEMNGVIQKLNNIICEQSSSNQGVTLVNTLSFKRNDVLTLSDLDDKMLDFNCKQQYTTNIDGDNILRVCGLQLNALNATTFSVVNKKENIGSSPFLFNGNTLTTPFAKVEFSDNGTIKSFYDLRENRQLVGGLPFNTFIICEDFPLTWDNWDLDADTELKYNDVSNLISREVISCGEVECRIRSKYQITKRSSITQDMIFYSSDARVDFDTLLDWNDAHHFLKTTFDTTIHSQFAKQEIQFGYVMRPTHRNTERDQAMFETLNHKYSDLSENRYGISILNDCKYGISVKGSNMRLSLIKGGTHPDPRADKGKHRFCYSLSPHLGGFCADNVVVPAYEFNIPPLQIKGEYKLNSLMTVASSNIIIETIKPCEDKQHAYIVRLYECENSSTNTVVTIGHDVKRIVSTNMLEEEINEISNCNTIELTFRPFEIKTIKIFY